MSHFLLGLIDLALRSGLIGCQRFPFISDQTEKDIILVFGGYTPLRFSAAA